MLSARMSVRHTHVAAAVAVLAALIFVVAADCTWYNTNFRPNTYTDGWVAADTTLGAQAAGACAGDTTQGCKWCALDTDPFKYDAALTPKRGECMATASACANTPHTVSVDVQAIQDRVVWRPKSSAVGQTTDPGAANRAANIYEVVYPNRYAYYKIKAPHRNFDLHVVVQTADYLGLGDNIDLYIRRGSPPTIDAWDFTSVRESNPWAIDIFSEDLHNHGVCTAAGCTPYIIGVMGDNQYPQRSGASEYQMKVWLEFNFTTFECDDAATPGNCYQLNDGFNVNPLFFSPTAGTNIYKVAFTQNAASDYVMRLLDNSANTNANKYKESAIWVTQQQYLKGGFETKFTFKISDPGHCSGLDGFCGGGDGFAFVINKNYDANNADTLTTKNNIGDIDCIAGVTFDETDPDAVGKACLGANLGFNGLTNALAVEFDTWFNKEYYDPKQGVEHWWINATEYVSYADNHIAVWASADSGSAPTQFPLMPNHGHVVDEGDPTETSVLLAATPSVPNMSDGNLHTVKLWYIPSVFTNVPGSLSIFIDNMQRPVLVVDVTLDSTYSNDVYVKRDVLDVNAFGDDGYAYLGFTAAAGMKTETIDIHSWGICQVLGCVAY